MNKSYTYSVWDQHWKSVSFRFRVSGARHHGVNLLPVRTMAESKCKCCCSVPHCSNSKQNQTYFMTFLQTETKERSGISLWEGTKGLRLWIGEEAHVCSRHFTGYRLHWRKFTSECWCCSHPLPTQTSSVWKDDVVILCCQLHEVLLKESCTLQ